MRALWDGIERMVYVVDAQWMTTLIGLIDSVTPMHIRAVGHDQADEGKRWLLEGTSPVPASG